MAVQPLLFVNVSCTLKVTHSMMSQLKNAAFFTLHAEVIKLLFFLNIMLLNTACIKNLYRCQPLNSCEVLFL